MGFSGILADSGRARGSGRMRRASRVRGRFAPAGFGLALAVCVSLALVAPVSLSAEPSEKNSQKQDSGDRAREAAVDAIGQDWVNRIQGREPAPGNAVDAGEDQNGERIGPVPLENAEGESADSNSEDGSVRLQNPGANDAAAGGNSGNAANAEPANENADSGETLGVLPRTEGPSLFSVIFRFFGLMALMVGLFYVGMRYLRAKSGAPVMGGSDLVQVLVSTPLVQGKFLQIVDVAGRLMVLGVSDSGVQMLETIDDGVVADRIRIWQSRRAVNGPLPTSLLDQAQKLFKTSDLRFWVSGDERAKQAPGFASFGDLLSGQVPAAASAGVGGASVRPEAPAAPTAKRSRRKRTEDVDLFDDSDRQTPDLRGESASVDVPEEQVPDEIALKNLLKQQKRRLAGINRKKRDDSK
ncbi:MAG: flagellar biosynthetic protein FliO [bacterium]|nr:flagellar biosynthetic protein FliO [bacterium]